MKKILLSTFVIAAMTSCSQNEIVTDSTAPAKPISFMPQFGNSVVSRATTNLGNDVTLGVYAYNGGTPSIYDAIENLPLAYDADASPAGWYLTPKEHYYPEDKSEVSFWAYGPKADNHLTTLDCEAANGPKFTLTLANTDANVDIYATQAEVKGKKETASTPIVFELKRVMAQVKFKAQTATADDATAFDVKIYSITIETKGKADYANKTWGSTHTGDAVTWTVIDTEQSALTASATTQGNSVNLIPEQEATITVKAKVYKKSNDVVIADQTATLSLNSGSSNMWAQGNSYTYTIKVTPNVGKITFGQPTVEDWAETAGGDVTV